ncbi:MAG: hypothetical protein QHH12_08315, partial [Candidatus Bathyarchaeota archaeon]|nr:hypothetical protein [Candidatus Bathyarchaeota archaeon]
MQVRSIQQARAVSFDLISKQIFLFRRYRVRRRIFILRAVIFANGQLSRPIVLQPDDLIIAADGGTHHCLGL